MAHDAYFGAVRDGSAPHPEWQGNRPAEAFVGSQGGAMLILHR
jgi:hypothetical protein